MKTSEIINGFWRKIWNLRRQNYVRISILLSCIYQHTSYIGWCAGAKGYQVNHDRRGVIAEGRTIKKIVKDLVEEGIIIDDLGLHSKFKFEMED